MYEKFFQLAKLPVNNIFYAYYFISKFFIDMRFDEVKFESEARFPSEIFHNSQTFVPKKIPGKNKHHNS